MADFLPDLPSFAGGVGALALLAWLVVRVMNQSSGDRNQYQQIIDKEREAHDKEIAEIEKRYDNQIAELRGQVVELRSEVREMREQLEEERRARWAAEDAAARYRREAQRTND